MTASIRILTASSLDSNPSLLIVSADGSKTLINCGEGCQRSFLESSSPTAPASAAPGCPVATPRVSSVNRVCLTHLGHDSLGGLPGMILTTADVAESIAKEMSLGKIGKNNNNDHYRRRSGNGNGGTTKNDHKRNGSLISNNDDVYNGGGGRGDDDDLPDLEIVGPNGTQAFLHSLRHFMRRDRFKIHAHEGRYDSSVNDNKASASFNAKKRIKRTKNAKFDKSNKERGDNSQIGFSVKSVPITYEAYEYPEHYDASDPTVRSLISPEIRRAMSYLFVTPPIPGKFLIEKAQALNVPKGPMYGQLKGGKSVTFTDPETGEERTVHSKEVVAESSPGVGVAVIYCPSMDALDKLTEDETFRAFEAQKEEGDGAAKESSKGEPKRQHAELDVMVHLTPESVFRTRAYRSWCMKFGPNVDHVTLHAAESLAGRCRASEEEQGNSPFVSGICGGIRRSFVHHGLFPMPLLALPQGSGKDDNDDDKQENGGHHCGDGDDLQTITGLQMMEYVLMPRSRRGPNRSTMGGLYTSDVVNRLREKAKDSGAIESASAIIAESSSFDAKERNDHAGLGGNETGRGNNLGELIFTGTGSAIPCKHRNVTGMYLRMSNGNGMLLDVGEGTVGQLLQSWKSTLTSSSSREQRTNSIEEYRFRLRGIKAVWISHPHADHHLGLLRLLSERTAIVGTNDPIVLMAPPDMFHFLEEYQSAVPGSIDRSYIPVDCEDMLHGRRNPLGDRLYETLGITWCASVPVAHCQRSYAVVIDGTSFGRVAYSGDCRPSNRFADVARGADLLIHEATFEDGMEEDAVLKRHSTVGEALGIARRMDARSLVLTHFSQRYPKIPPLNEQRAGGGGQGDDGAPREITTVFAFDFMRLMPNTVRLAARLTPALRLLYPREGGDEVDSAAEKVTAKELMAVPGVFAVKGVL